MNTIQKSDWELLQSIILMVVLYAWIALLSAVLGIFYAPAIVITWLILSTFFYYKKILKFPTPTREFLSYILIAFAFTLLISYFTTPTIFSGRDQGALSEAAMRLSQNTTLIQHTDESTTFFDIYGYGKALNFPGFFYTPDGGLLTQFPLPYISFLSGFFGIFGVSGLIIANATLLFTFIISIAIIARYYMSHRYTLIFLSILLTSFSIGWFAKFTLSENIAGMLLWNSVALYLSFKKNTNSTTFFTIFATISLLLFSRIEGIWFFAIISFLLLRNQSIKKFIKKDLWWRAFFPITILFVTACTVAIMNIPFFTTMFTASSGAAADILDPTSLIDKFTYLFSVYSLYGLLLPLLLTISACLFAIKYKRYRKILLPFIVVFPLSIYYLFPQISSDHPWMLRRFVFALLPATIFTSVAFISYLRSATILRRSAKFIILAALLLTNLFTFITFIAYSENNTLQNQIADLSLMFEKDDLILIDKETAGSGWSMITNPLRSLHNKRAVYFFNPYDFNKLDTSNFNRVFLMTPNVNKDIYTSVLPNMNYVTKYSLTVNQLNISQRKTTPPLLPAKEIKTIRGVIYELTTQ